jgi:hypothetical protein
MDKFVMDINYTYIAADYSLKSIRCDRDTVIGSTSSLGYFGMALNSAMRVCALGRIPVCPEPPLVFWHEHLGRLCPGFLVVSPLRIAYAFLH